MIGKMKRLTALVLAVTLLASPFSEMRLYATETEDLPKTEEYTESSTDNEDESESALETTSEAERNEQSGTKEAESETESSAQGTTESESETQSATEEESASAMESEAETEVESESESETESMTEDTTDIMAESMTEVMKDEDAEIEYPCPVELEPENVPYDENQESFTDRLVNTKARDTLPEKYDAREEGYLPAIRNQDPWGACWCFSLLGAMEVSAVRDLGVEPDEIDLSERHLAYFGYNTGYDALNNANEDTMTMGNDVYYLDNGGNDIRGVIRLMNWNGGADEKDYPYGGTINSPPDALERNTAQDAKIYLENAHRYNFAEAIADKDQDGKTTTNAEKKAEAIKVVKKMIIDYGAVSWSYWNNTGDYLNTATGAYYNNVGGSGTGKTNHAIMVVGWDDNYSRENFKEGKQPENDGAWIIRNSWGKRIGSSGNSGYYYMSYEDVSLGSGNPVYAFEVCDSAKYDNNYFYGNTAFSNATIAVRRAAQVFQIKSENAVREKLTAVSFLIGTSDVDYELQIYKNPDMKNGKVVNPTSGTPMLDTPQKGKTGFAGLHTIELATPVILDTDDYVSVVLTFPDTKPNMYFDRSYTSDGGQQKGVHVLAEGRSFYGPSLTSWTDNYANDRTFRINVLTVNCDDVMKTPEIKKIDVTEAQGFDQLPQISICWGKCTDAQGYRLYRSEDHENYALIDTVDCSVRQYTDVLSERKAGQYYYKVEAVYHDGTETSDVVSQRVEGVIKTLKLSLMVYDENRAVFTWNRIIGAEKYELWKISNENGNNPKEVHIADFAADDERSYTIDTDGWELGNYHYKVCAVCGDEQTAWSEACMDLKWSQISYYKAYFEWLPVEGAASCKLFHKVNGKSFSASVSNRSVILSTNSTYYRPCDEHQYYLNAYDAAGNVIYTSSTIVFQMIPDALSIDQAEYDYANTITITWSGGLGADTIAIYRSENPSEKGELIAEVEADNAEAANEVSYMDTIYKGKEYWYSLLPIAIQTDGSRVEGQLAVYDKILTFPDAAALETAQYIEDNGVSLAWTAAKGADGYWIERRDNQNEFAMLAAVEGSDKTAYTDQSVEAGNRYQYRVQSYYVAEDGNRMTMPTESVSDVEILPNPVELSTIAELKRESANDQPRVALSWNAVENAQSYAIYRSVASGSVADNYVCIAKNITERQFTDDTVVPDTPYRYKLIVTVNGLASELEKTVSQAIMIKPVLTALEMSAENLEIVNSKEMAFNIVSKPTHYPYEQELVWSAHDENGNALEIVQENDTLVINGVDGKQILYIANGKIHAVGDSDTVRTILTAAINEISAECNIFVYNDDFWVSGVKDLTYTGGALTQNIAVYNGNRLLEEDVDYTISYKNNVKVSTEETNMAKKPAIIVKGKGGYTGAQTIYFEILPEPDSEAGKTSLIKATVKSIGTMEYQGTAIEPKPIVKVGSKALTEGVDYTLSYENNKGVGEAAVVISGINDYKGTKKAAFTINYNMQNDEAGLMQVTFDTQDVPYVKGGAKPTIKVYCGDKLLKENTDYKLSYKNNKAIAAASDKKAPTVVITGKGNYKGKREVSFNIVQQDIGGLTLTAKDMVYTEKAGKFATSFVITDKDGKKLSAGRDYDKNSVVYTYAETGEPVGKTDIVPRGTELCITVKAAETGAYRGSIRGTYRIAAYDIGKAKVTVEPQIYTGSEIEPDSKTGLKVTYKGYDNGLTEGVDYEITGYSNNVKKGTAKLYIKGLNDFGGTKTVNFKIKTKMFQWWWQK